MKGVIQDYFGKHEDPTRTIESMTYRSVTLYYDEGEDTDWYIQNEKLGDTPDSLLPEGARVGGFTYILDIKEYRYLISGQTVLLSSESGKVSFEERMEQGREEMFLIIDDILDQGGLPR